MGGYKKNKNGFIDIKIEKLIDWNEESGVGCICSDKITKEGFKVGYMYRGKPIANCPDSGWIFMAGDEDEEYIGNPNKNHILDINTVCNYDKDIIPYIHSKIGSMYIRVDNKRFEIYDGTKPIFIAKQGR